MPYADRHEYGLASNGAPNTHDTAAHRGRPFLTQTAAVGAYHPRGPCDASQGQANIAGRRTCMKSYRNACRPASTDRPPVANTVARHERRTNRPFINGQTRSETYPFWKPIFEAQIRDSRAHRKIKWPSPNSSLSEAHVPQLLGASGRPPTANTSGPSPRFLRPSPGLQRARAASRRARFPSVTTLLLSPDAKARPPPSQPEQQLRAVRP